MSMTVTQWGNVTVLCTAAKQGATGHVGTREVTLYIA